MMVTPHAWLDVARSTERAAGMLYREHPRSAASRAYYAAFAACHALLLHFRPQVNRPGRGHFRRGNLPGELRWTLLRPEFASLSTYQAEVYRDLLDNAYNLRRIADYKPDRQIAVFHAAEAIDAARSLLRLAERYLK